MPQTVVYYWQLSFKGWSASQQSRRAENCELWTDALHQCGSNNTASIWNTA